MEYRPKMDRFIKQKPPKKTSLKHFIRTIQSNKFKWIRSITSLKYYPSSLKK